jgi:Fe-S-cluster containining protein
MHADVDESLESVNVELKISTGEWQLQATLSVPRGPRQARDLLPLTRSLSHAVVQAENSAVAESGRTISCRSGCGACCRQLVAISVIEAESLARLVAEMPAAKQAVIRARFAEAVRRLEEQGLLDSRERHGDRALVAENRGSREASLQRLSQRYFKLQIPCPFLENESCSIYEDRPLVCREYHVTSPPERCEKLFEDAVDRVEMPIRIADVLTRTLHRLTNTPAYSIPLVLSLEWAEACGTAFDQTYDGVETLKILVNEIGQELDRSSPVSS